MKPDRLAWRLHSEATKDQFAADELHLGPWTSYSFINDPRHTLFVLSRYKFVAKMLEGKTRVLEVGCGDGFGAPIVAQAVKELVCVDWEEKNIEGNRRRLSHLSNVSFEVQDVSTAPPVGKFEAIFSIDVLEHVEPEFESAFMNNLVESLEPNGVMIIGTPNESASPYASPQSESQHINLKTRESLRALSNKYFENSFSFSMNDETLHTGYGPMSHYLWVIGVGKKI
jgi:2-polyprenyl-3-methyl-5-hydroxy-6-metoxy-1,4-benzoquinol methylase